MDPHGLRLSGCTASSPITSTVSALSFYGVRFVYVSCSSVDLVPSDKSSVSRPKHGKFVSKLQKLGCFRAAEDSLLEVELERREIWCIYWEVV